MSGMNHSSRLNFSGATTALPKLKRPPELCYYAFSDRSPEGVATVWEVVQQDKQDSSFEGYCKYDVTKGFLQLMREAEGRVPSKAAVSEAMSEVFSKALMQGYEDMNDIVDEVSKEAGFHYDADAVRDTLAKFLPEKILPFVSERYRKYDALKIA